MKIWTDYMHILTALLVAGSVWTVLSMAEPIANRLGRYGISVAFRPGRFQPAGASRCEKRSGWRQRRQR